LQYYFNQNYHLQLLLPPPPFSRPLVVMLVRNEDQAKSINDEHKNNRYLTSYTLPNNVVATVSPTEALAGALFVVLAIPCQQMGQFLRDHKGSPCSFSS